MTPQPIAFRMPELRRLDEGGLSFFRRMADGVLARANVGDLCWVREPYFLPAQFDGHRPTAALDRGASPTFLSEVGYARTVDQLGELRAARLLCRPWHRRHLRILRVAQQRIQDVDADDIRTAGYRDRFDFAQGWDQGIQMRGHKAHWSANPVILRIEFELIDAPLPRTVSGKRTRPDKWEPAAAQLALRARTLSAFGSTVQETFSASQVDRIVRIRDAVAWVLRQTWPELTFDQLGALLEGKDHTTARTMVGRAHKRRGEDAAFKLITDDLTRGTCAGVTTLSRLRVPSARPSVDNPQVHLPTVPRSLALKPPAGRRWCDQCEQLADQTRAAACTSPFCKVKPKELERA